MSRILLIALIFLESISWTQAATKVPKPLVNRMSPMGQKWSATFGADGSVNGISQCKANQLDDNNCRITDTGTWKWVEGNKYCITWKSWLSGCFEDK
jgi:hypothetical protein